MATVDLIMPKMGESIMEATILKWLKEVGDTVELDEPILEIATDKVDSEIPSPVEGTITEILFQENDIVEIGIVIAKLSIEGESAEPVASPAILEPVKEDVPPAKVVEEIQAHLQKRVETAVSDISTSDRFYSPLVKSMAKKEGIPLSELDNVPGTGKDNRLTKQDMLSYIKTRTSAVAQTKQTSAAPTASASPAISISGGEEIIQMDRMRKLIAEHMVMSKQTSPHVTSFVEADVTNIWNWRNANKSKFAESYGEKLTFTPIFVEAVARAIRDFPMINVSVNGDQIIRKPNINIGMATALPSGNLIVPVIKDADFMNLAGLAKAVNDLANRARNNKLKPDEVQGGTFTLTNVGTFGNVMGTPIINQPQVAIMAVGAIRKKPAVVETEYGDVVAVRHMMFLSMSYDHRVVDGILGGSFIRKVADYLEAFDLERII